MLVPNSSFSTCGHKRPCYHPWHLGHSLTNTPLAFMSSNELHYSRFLSMLSLLLLLTVHEHSSCLPGAGNLWSSIHSLRRRWNNTTEETISPCVNSRSFYCLYYNRWNSIHLYQRRWYDTKEETISPCVTSRLVY